MKPKDVQEIEQLYHKVYQEWETTTLRDLYDSPCLSSLFIRRLVEHWPGILQKDNDFLQCPTCGQVNIKSAMDLMISSLTNERT